jgi:hypothetical protein
VTVIARGRSPEAISNFEGEIASHKPLAMTCHKQVGCAPAVTVIARGRSPEAISNFEGEIASQKPLAMTCHKQACRVDRSNLLLAGEIASQKPLAVTSQGKGGTEKTTEQARVLCLPWERHRAIAP